MDSEIVVTISVTGATRPRRAISESFGTDSPIVGVISSSGVADSAIAGPMGLIFFVGRAYCEFV